MKDVMEGYTGRVRALRISKTGAKEWTLYGPIDQALKTSVQAGSVRVVPMTPKLHGMAVDCELWVAASAPSASEPPNMNAMVMLTLQQMRERGEVPEGPFAVSVQSLTPVMGPAILTGPGGTDLPEISEPHLLAVLMGSAE